MKKRFKNTTKCCNTDYVLSIDYENGIETETPYVCNSCQDFCEVEGSTLITHN
jgi:hypothetical protein